MNEDDEKFILLIVNLAMWMDLRITHQLICMKVKLLNTIRAIGEWSVHIFVPVGKLAASSKFSSQTIKIFSSELVDGADCLTGRLFLDDSESSGSFCVFRIDWR